ncbi:MAG: leucyl aminopeptidase [Nitrospirae bacterium]|nr:leucyl aminopeptidase [Nitrospirota bacterium]
MVIRLTKSSPLEVETQGLVIPVFEDKTPVVELDGALQKELRDLKKKGIFKGEFLEEYLFHFKTRNISKRILICGLGKSKEITSEKLRQCGGAISKAAKKTRLKDIYVDTSQIKNLKPSALLEGILLGSYRFIRYKKEKDTAALKTLLFPDNGRITQKDIEETKSVAEAVCFARDLVNIPSNELTPTDILKTARSLKSKRLSIKALNRKEAKKAGLNAFVAVSNGSHQEPWFIIMNYRGGGRKTVVLIGKSITFDSGGLSLKPSEGMEKMKYDMAGGAAVLSVMRYIEKKELPCNVIGILPATENLPGGSATKPGDIVKAFNGKTIEIVNTDAEGRLTLSDAIAYAKKYRPDVIIDIATLTGACSIALGNEAMALMGNNERIIELLKTSAEKTGERLWHMPLYEDYKEYIKSDVADLKNTGGRTGSLVTAGYFLKEFAEDTPWGHIDIASTAWTDRDRHYCPKGATGVGVRLIIQFLKEYGL